VLSNSSTSSSERQHIYRFLRKAALFASPWLLVALVECLVDPFGFLFSHSLITEAVKQRIAIPLNPCVVQLSRFTRNPAPIVFLGDSRMVALKEDKAKEVTGEEVRNLAYGGGSLREALDSFYYADSVVPLKAAVLGINFDSYNDYAIIRRTETFRTIHHNLALYFVNRTVLQATVYTLYSVLSGVDLKLGVPRVDPKTFWDDTIHGAKEKRMIANYIRPREYKQELVDLADYCNKKGIKLTFVIFPTHRELRESVEEGRADDYMKFKEVIAAIAPTYDFDRPSVLTNDERNFIDPLHTTAAWTKPILAEFWFGQAKYSALLAGGYSDCHSGSHPKSFAIPTSTSSPDQANGLSSSASNKNESYGCANGSNTRGLQDRASNPPSP
jgi:hypothetical protein